MRPPARGTTLLEILIAMTILSVIAAGVFVTFAMERLTTTTAQTHLQASGYAQQTAESLREAVRPTSRHPDNPELDLRVETGPPQPRPHTLPADHPLGVAAARQYTVQNGKFTLATGGIVWGAMDGTTPDPNDAGRRITDDNYDLKAVTITVDWTPPGQR